MEEQTTIQCPYDKSHFILAHRMAVHLLKCEKQHQDVALVSCVYDKTHRVRKNKLKEHYNTCNARDQTVFMGTSSATKEVVEEIPAQPVVEVPGEENWDLQPPHPGYVPEKHLENPKIMLMCPPGLTKSQRKEFRIKERLRLSRLQ